MNRSIELEPDALEYDEYEFDGEYEFDQAMLAEVPFDEAEEMELAAELLEVSDEAELDQFLGKLIKKAWKGIRKVGKTAVRPLGGALKAVAKKALPFVGGALGSFIPIPGVGTAVGTALGGALSNALELEYEGLDPEDKEFEMARSFVRIAGATARQAALAQPGLDPQAAVRKALISAVRQQAPGLAEIGRTARGSKQRARRNGRWIRRGQAIVLLGA